MFEQLKALLVDEFAIDEDLITLDAELKSDLGINSLELAELAFQCEEALDIEIKDDDIHKFVTVRDVVDYLENR